MAQTSSKKIEGLDEFSPMNFVENDSFSVEMDSNKFLSIGLPQLTWLHLDKMPSKVTIRNSGYLLNVEPEYSGEVPSLNGSVLLRPYKFWCFHFHWGPDNENGSVHCIDGMRTPTEIHLVFYNVKYSNTIEALKAKDGVLVLVYMCKLTDLINPTLENLTLNLEKITEPHKSTCVDAFPMSSLFDANLTDYMLYWRAYYGGEDEKQTPWIISMQPAWINASQLSRLRSLRGIGGSNIVSNYRCQGQYRRSENVFIVTSDYTPTAGVGEPERPAGRVVGTRAPGAADSFDLEGGGGGGGGGGERVRKTECGDEPGGVKMKKMCAIRSIEMLMQGHVEDDLSESAKTETDEPRKAQITHREGVRMNETAIRREIHIKNKLKKNAERKKK